MADPVQARAKQQRLAKALRINLKRRKLQLRERGSDDIGPQHADEHPAGSVSGEERTIKSAV